MRQLRIILLRQSLVARMEAKLDDILSEFRQQKNTQNTIIELRAPEVHP